MPGARPTDVPTSRAARLDGGRSDFLANLERRAADLRSALRALRADPGSAELSDELRRRVHALQAGARFLRFDKMAGVLADAERMLDRGGAERGLAEGDATALTSTFTRLGDLATSDDQDTQRASEPPPPTAGLGVAGRLPATVLVVGPADLAAALGDAGPSEAVAWEQERVEQADGTVELARVLAPDVIVIDSDVAGASKLVERLSRDPLTEAVPVLLIGTLPAGDAGAAHASFALQRPVLPFELRHACEQLIVNKHGGEPAAIGSPTLEELGERLAEEVRRGVMDAVGPAARSQRVRLGEGADVLAPVWGAVARVREVVQAKSGGTLRFGPLGPEGAFPVSFDSALPPVERRGAGAPARAPDEPTRIEGRRVVVADADPTIAWYLAAVLREAGAEVWPVHGGAEALATCLRVTPDLVVADARMPGLDGLGLLRALRRDIVLRDVPLILLSWKEDLLARLLEHGADAASLLQKDATATQLPARAAEALRAKDRVEERLRAPGEVRGRLDGISFLSLLERVARARPSCRLSVADAAFAYDVQLRDGAPRSATRTSNDGTFERGPHVLAAMLGMRAGRFAVVPVTGAVREDLSGDLRTLVDDAVAHARAAQQLLAGSRLLDVHAVGVAADRVTPYVAVTRATAREVALRVLDGESPRTLVLSGEVAPDVVEGLLADFAAFGAIERVAGADGEDRLAPAVAVERAKLRAPAPTPPPATPTPMPGRARSATTPPPPPAPAPFVEPDALLSDSVPPAPRPPRPSAPSPALGVDEALAAQSDEPPESSPRSDAQRPRPAPRALAWLLLGAVLTAAVVVGLQAVSAGRRARAPEPPPRPTPSAVAAPTVAAPTITPVTDDEGGAPAPSASAPEIAPGGEDLPLPAGASLGPGQGMLEVVAGARDTVVLDRAELGHGPLLRVAVDPGTHEVRVRTQGDDRVRFAFIREGRRTRLPFTAPWQH